MVDDGFLSGVRVIELGYFWAAPYCAALLADMGAEVIKIESVLRPDMRLPKVVDDKVVLEPIPFHRVLNRNKRNCAINLRDPRGALLLRKLASLSDILVENLSVSARKKLGVDYEDLVGECPSLVYVSLSGFGSTGPFSEYRGFGPTFEAMSGLESMVGYADRPAGIGVGITDPLGGIHGALVAIAGLLQRRRDGKGQHVDLAQLEDVMTCLPEPIIDYFMNGRIAGRQGNFDTKGTPSNAYPCTGNNEWVGLTISSPDQWEQLKRVSGLPELEGERFATVEARVTNRKQLDRLISKWTSRQDAHDVAATLQRAGVPAFPILKVDQVIGDRHLRDRGAFAQVGDELMYTTMFRVARQDADFERPPIRSAAPDLGEANDYVFGGLLGLSPGEIQTLTEDGVLR